MESDSMSNSKHVRMLTRYKAWADNLVFSMVSDLPHEEAMRPRATVFGNIVHTLNHVYVIDRVFQSHLTGRGHNYTARNTPTHPPLAELWDSVRTVDGWYIELAERITADELDRRIQFEFIGGGEGAMTCLEMILHVVNHGTYHRGFVADMLCQSGVTPKATDLPVFLRDVPQVY
jgi:uncharacterized damage-inducible protein DinB